MDGKTGNQIYSKIANTTKNNKGNEIVESCDRKHPEGTRHLF